MPKAGKLAWILGGAWAAALLVLVRSRRLPRSGRADHATVALMALIQGADLRSLRLGW